MNLPRILGTIALGALTLPACVSVDSDETLFVGSDPPGAAILIDGRPTGMFTPCNLDVEDDCTVRLDLQGYPSVSRVVDRVTHFRLVKFRDGMSPYTESPSILGWALPDLLWPFQFHTRNEPRRVFVTFRPLDQ
ncbi:MAG: PEGA domain-containing protein [Planctomycetes bacterium]|nr:PEGA domain-containing protein [Planctomycetota bacterium]